MAGKTHGIPTVPDPDESTLGPAMLALPESQRRFVVCYSQGMSSKASAIAAGYSYNPEKPNGLEVAAHRLSHDSRISEALLELAKAAMAGRGAAVAINTLIEIAGDPTAEKKDRRGASDSLLDRLGISVITEHKVAVTHENLTPGDTIKRLEYLSEKFGFDPAKVVDSVMVDAEYEEVKSEPDDDLGDIW